MKRTITRTAILSLMFLLSFSLYSYAQPYHDVYLCDNASVGLHMPEETTLVAGDKVYWFKDGNAVPVASFIYSAPNSTNLIIPGTLAVGLHKYTTAIESVGGCLGPQSNPFEIYKLPSKALALSAPSNLAYCGDNSGPSASATITATTSPGAALPSGVGYEYTWSVTKDGIAVSPITSIGSDDASKTATNIFTMNTTAEGAYVFNAKVKYVLLAGNTGVFKAGDSNGCEVTATSSQTVTVTPKPKKPTISLVN